MQERFLLRSGLNLRSAVISNGMTLSTKILIILGSILTVGMLSFIIYKQLEISNRQQAIESQVVLQKELVGNIMRSQNSYATKDDINQLIKDNGLSLKAIQDDLSKLHAEITAVNAIVVSSNGQHGTNLPSTGTGPSNPNPIDPVCKDGTPCPTSDPFEYQKKTQQLSLHEEFGSTKVPFGTIGFSAWQKAPWSVDILPREYHVTNVVGTDENQRTYFYNKFSVKVDGKTYDVKISSAQTKQEYPEAKWSFMNPRLFAGIDGGFNISQNKAEFTPSASVSIISYGRFKAQPDFSVLQVGIGYGTVSRKPQLVITPFSYNIGKHIPLMNNTYIGPSLQAGTDGSVSAMIGLRVGL